MISKFFIYYLEISYLLKTLIFGVFIIGNIKAVYNEYMFIKNRGDINSSGFYKDKEDEKRALKIGKQFFKKCANDILINQQSFEKNDNPLVSVVIPVYNAEMKIKKAIRSIQNQNTSNLEIILVNDCSNDKTIDIIKTLQKNDKRIILMENKENRGILYTRCIGTLKATGKYIFPLDNDDLFFDEEIIDSIVDEATRENLDIVEFNYAEFHKMNVPPNKFVTSEFGNHTHNLLLYQPELGQFPRNKNNKYGVYDCYIWAKCIKANLYKDTINKMGKIIYSKYILRGEDFIITFILFRLASSFKFFAKYGIFRFKNFETAQYKSSRELYLLSRIIYLEIITRFTEKNFDDKMYVVDFCYTFFKILKDEINILNKQNQIYFKKVFRRLLTNKYIEIEHKNNFITFFKKFGWIFRK